MDKRAYFSITRNKNGVRKQIIAQRVELSASKVRAKSLAITKKIIGSSIFSTGNRVSLYLPIKNEVETHDIINFFVEAGVEVYLPKYLKETDEYQLARFRGWGDLKEGPLGILEPKSGGMIDTGKIDLAFFPGVAFDKNGVRLGYGKGVFDTLFAKSKAVRVGLAYELQIVDVIPRENHDLKMDFVVTEERVLDFIDLGSKNEVVNG
ncbi:MAG: 5-formyltetrahydrofolate cyclo-ligase [Candidatus Curtissbacteria bacterium]|nr:5-formyltetrahydrofolate cyclo-ligase [Candidatus Curtissbacteria bacterium]